MTARPLFDHRHFDPAALAGAKGVERVAVVIPARDEAPTIGRIVRTISRDLRAGAGLVDDIVVVDDGSVDRTATIAASAGARVVASEGRGKGAAMWSGLAATDASIVVFCDGDLRNFGAHFVAGLCGPLLLDSRVALVKGYYQRPRNGENDEGGRVTELTARPALRLLAPHVGSIIQPLGGEVAGRRDALEQVPFVEGYGVDVALVLDVARRFGADCIAQVDLGTRIHRNRPLHELAAQADIVLRTILDRAGVDGIEPVAARPPLRGSATGDRVVTGPGRAELLDDTDAGLGVVRRFRHRHLG